jgi:hypothetical protein
MVQQLLQSGGLPPGFNLGALAQSLGIPQPAAPNGMGGPGSNMGGGSSQGFGQLGGGFGQGGGLGGQGGGLSALTAANPQLAALAGSYMANQQSGGAPPQREQGFEGLTKQKADSGSGSASGAPSADALAEWAEPFAGKGKKEPPFPLKLHQVRTSIYV